MAIDWEAARDEVIQHLQALIRIDTTNPPGNETAAARYLAGVAREAGISHEIVEGAPGRGNFVARLAGNGAGRPVALLAHSDVVGVERARWTRDPFGGELADGFVWGRGALDMKGQLAVHLTVATLLQREGVRLGRDVILAAFADEEAGGEWGAGWLWAHRRDLIDAEYGICEFGGQRLEIAGRPFYTVQVGEKGVARMRLTARGAPGHASVPLADTAISRLAEALVRLRAFEPPTIITPPVAQMLRAVGAATGAGDAIEAILARPSRDALAALPLDPESLANLRATTRNTAVPTILGGGETINVIPSEAWADINGRILPGEDPAEWARQVGAAVGDGVEVTLTDGAPGVAADPASPFFDALAATMAAAEPGAALLPYLVPGATDASALPGIKVYGFLPSRHSGALLGTMHGHDERISADDLLFATRCLHDVMLRFCAT